MSDDLAKTLNCPACGAPLEFDGRSAVIRCKFCRNVSFVPGVLPAQAAAPGPALDEIRRLAKAGNLIEAVKKYRALFDVGLKEAKDAVEALQAGRLAAPAEAEEGRRPPEEQTRLLEEVQRLLADGDKIEAIKVYRQIFDVSLARARYAVEQIEAGQTVQPEAGFPAQTAAAPAPGPDKTGSRVGCAILGAILLLVGGILAFAFSMPGGPFNPRYYVSGPAILVPSEGGSAPDVAAVFYNPEAEARLVALVNGETGKFRWRAEPLAGDGYADAIAHGGGLLYVVSETDLLAYRTSDGSLAWQARMPDQLSYGDAALLVTDGRVITLNVDQSVQAYDAAAGSLVWSRRLAGYDRTLRLMGGSLVLIDYTGEDYTYSLVFLDPANGDQQRLLTPACQYNEHSSDTIDPSSGLLYDEAGNAIYLVFDSSPGCVQRIDLARGQLTWQTLAEDSFSYYASGFNALLTETALYFSSGHELLRVETASGVLKTLLADEDYEFLPLASSGERLIVRARRTRGTERFELWGIESTYGERLWRLDLAEASPIDPPNEMAGLVDEGDSGWTWRLVPAGLALAKFQADPNQIVLDTIDPADGTSLGEQTLAMRKVSGDFYSIPTVIGWQDGVVFLDVDGELYALDLEAGELRHIR